MVSLAGFWLHHTAHCAEKISVCYVRRFCVSRKCGTGGGGGVTHRVTCTWWLLGLAVKVPWLGQFLPWLHGQASKTLLSPCRGFISGREGCLVPERGRMTTESADYCMLVNEWAWSRSRVCLLRLEVDLGSASKTYGTTYTYVYVYMKNIN